nr:protease inhibitor Inh/omp19 family protein [Rhizobium setariae]
MLSGCASDRMDTYDNSSVKPQPLEAQPVAPVEAGQLPDPTTDTAQFPQKPVVDPALGQNTQADAAAAAAALDIKKEAMVGGWKVNAGGANCDMFLTLTNLGSGSRGGTRGCSGELMAMGSWEVSGKQVVLKDRAGNQLARLYKTAENRFDGSLANSGQPVSLSR